MNNTALIITIIGAVNWLLVGLFKFHSRKILFLAAKSSTAPSAVKPQS